jgi:hypothetical protein
VARSCAVAAALVLLLAAGAAADGDPASDVLLLQNAFFPVPAPSQDARTALSRAVAAAYAKGFRVKVAVVAAPTDLGSVPSLFDKPTDYAKFLGTELQLVYIGPLLIAMPAGFGIYDGGRSTASEETVLAPMPIGGTSADDLTRSAAAAVTALLQAGALRSKDILEPFAQPLQASGRRGRPLRLAFRLYDDSGRAGATLTLRTLAGRLVARIGVPLRRIGFQTIVRVTWTVPRTVAPGPLQLCVVPIDPSGNHGRIACDDVLVT